MLTLRFRHRMDAPLQYKAVHLSSWPISVHCIQPNPGFTVIYRQDADSIFTLSLLVNTSGFNSVSVRFMLPDDNMWFFISLSVKLVHCALHISKCWGLQKSKLEGWMMASTEKKQENNSHVGRVLRPISSVNIKLLSCRNLPMLYHF